jgi:hypothetical protein
MNEAKMASVLVLWQVETNMLNLNLVTQQVIVTEVSNVLSGEDKLIRISGLYSGHQRTFYIHSENDLVYSRAGEIAPGDIIWANFSQDEQYITAFMITYTLRERRLSDPDTRFYNNEIGYFVIGSENTMLAAQSTRFYLLGNVVRRVSRNILVDCSFIMPDGSNLNLPFHGRHYVEVTLLDIRNPNNITAERISIYDVEEGNLIYLSSLSYDPRDIVVIRR